METRIMYIVRTVYLFLSYLWGMETRYLIYDEVGEECSYPTYEEWKQA